MLIDMYQAWLVSGYIVILDRYNLIICIIKSETRFFC